MRLDVTEQGKIALREVYEPVELVTAEGNTLLLCMRDDTVELSVAGSDRWYRADMETGEVTEM